MSFASGFTPAEIQYQLSHLDETKVPIIMGAVGAFTTLATIAVFLRILVRRLKKNKYQADDYTLFIAFVSIYRGELGHCTSMLIPRQILTWGSFVTFYYSMLSEAMLLIQLERANSKTRDTEWRWEASFNHHARYVPPLWYRKRLMFRESCEESY